MFNLSNLLGNKNNLASVKLTKDQVAELLKTTPAALSEFENAYKTQVLDTEVSENLFHINSRQAADKNSHLVSLNDSNDLINRIVDELVCQTSTFIYNGECSNYDAKCLPSFKEQVTLDEVSLLPKEIRPDLTGNLMKRDINEDASDAVLWFLKEFLETNDKKRKQFCYNHFRQGLDILDLDPILYEIIGCNKNSMGYWLPKLIQANRNHGFFKIPKTTIAKVPITMLQLTRQEYTGLSPTTLKIVDSWAEKVFGLKPDGDYFIKTGTYSSKFDFRNCRVHDPKEISELGEYLLYIHYQALQMASPLSKPCIYGVSTTNEWVVREYITDKENNPCIYKGLPLHTEYRVFIDGNTKQVLGIVPYWDPETMKNRFSNESDADSLHNVHDYVIYKAHEDLLMARYNEYKDTVTKKVKEMLCDFNIPGQWSLDIMQNGNDFWLIDMGIAENSAFYEKAVPLAYRHPSEENWIPKIASK